MEFWEHFDWLQQHRNILKAFGSLEKSNQYNSKQIQNELKESNLQLSKVSDGVSALSSQLAQFVSIYTEDKALTAQIEAERFEFNLYWQSMTIEERKDFLRAKDELLAQIEEEERQAQAEWDAGAPERERNHKLIVEQNKKQSAIATQMNKEYLARLKQNEQQQLERARADRTLQNTFRQAALTIWLAFGLATVAWITLSNSWANSVQNGSVPVSLALLFVPFLFCLVFVRWFIWAVFAKQYAKVAVIYSSKHSVGVAPFKLKFPYLRK